jgi:hypothetical protein
MTQQAPELALAKDNHPINTRPKKERRTLKSSRGFLFISPFAGVAK